MSVIVLKIGGSVLTDKNRSSTARVEHISRIAEEISQGLNSRLVLIHGAGSFGHHQAKEFGLKAGLNETSIRGMWPTHHAVKTLNGMIIDQLYNHGVYALPVHPLSVCVLRDGRIDHICTEPIIEMLARGIVPVLHGDVALDRTRGVDILSGDQIIAALAKSLNAKKVGIGTNVDGVYAKDFKIIDDISPSNIDIVKEALSGSGGVDVTGGMYGKITELMDLATSGIPSLVFNAEKPGNVSEFLRGTCKGTLIHGD
ncbi:isopentenyl phosphate kinase [Methanocella arvoryzae]|uniref:Isopentenyl phosphate kinase n=1 Tax=Methanocella arvoryzae (strain DSM 22066 / NBRC 105507 / MRE50) TaxID=351160 RepID=Q0W8D3_METAR|nr:isopentenyl phosphate kinase [Methanocella arvoryzae]CAJ35360.1 amino acid kinase [Methanocella arvoryzae MRE50]